MLVGGGHAHVQVLRMFAMDPPPRTRLTLVSDREVALYSGMVPGAVAGLYRPEDCESELPPLARFAGARFVRATMTGLDPANRRIELEDRPPLEYDLLSLDLGSTVRGLDLPGVRQHAVATRPIGRLVDRLEGEVERHAGRTVRVVVMGAGAAGFELACCLEARLRTAGGRPRVLLADRGEAPLRGSPLPVIAAAREVLSERGIEFRGGMEPEAVEADRVILQAGEAIGYDLLVWATGAAPHPFTSRLGLPLDARGFLRAGATLELDGQPDHFGAGDCIGIPEFPELPKAGVYAVREGPVLAANLRARRLGLPLQEYLPQSGFLSLLALGDGSALLSWKGRAARGRFVWWLKDRIDRAWMRKFEAATLRQVPMGIAGEAAAAGGDPARCAGCGAKVGGDALRGALLGLPTLERADIRVGVTAGADAAVVEVPPGTMAVQTVDAFPPPVDDPYLAGRLLAVHALSDLHAMGAPPAHALATVTLVEAAPRLQARDLRQAMAGVCRELEADGAALVGGHTTEGPELFLGLAATGYVRPGDLLGTGAVTVGDRVLLTRPIGTGVVLRAAMELSAPARHEFACLEAMLVSNRAAVPSLRRPEVRAVTDVTGFGLLGHLLRLVSPGGTPGALGVRLDPGAVQALPGARALAAAGVESSLAGGNASLLDGWLLLGGTLASHPLLLDPQTSGGLLVVVAPEAADECLADLLAAGYPECSEIAEVTGEPGVVEFAARGAPLASEEVSAAAQ